MSDEKITDELIISMLAEDEAVKYLRENGNSKAADFIEQKKCELVRYAFDCEDKDVLFAICKITGFQLPG